MSEEFLTPNYFLPTAAQGSSDLVVQVTEKTGAKPLLRPLDVSYSMCFYDAPI